MIRKDVLSIWGKANHLHETGPIRSQQKKKGGKGPRGKITVKGTLKRETELGWHIRYIKEMGGEDCFYLRSDRYTSLQERSKVYTTRMVVWGIGGGVT